MARVTVALLTHCRQRKAVGLFVNLAPWPLEIQKFEHRELNIEIHLNHFTLLKSYLYRNSTNINSDYNHNMSKAARYESYLLSKSLSSADAANLPRHHRLNYIPLRF